jgi:hypothetical protein
MTLSSPYAGQGPAVSSNGEYKIIPGTKIFICNNIELIEAIMVGVCEDHESGVQSDYFYKVKLKNGKTISVHEDDIFSSPSLAGRPA